MKTPAVFLSCLILWCLNSDASVLKISCFDQERNLNILISQSRGGEPSALRNGQKIGVNRMTENEVEDVYFFFQFVNQDGRPTHNLKITDSENEKDHFKASFGTTPFDQVQMLCFVPQ